MSLDEVAGALVTSVGAVKTAPHRARKRLEQINKSDEVSTKLVRRLSVSPALVDRFVGLGFARPTRFDARYCDRRRGLQTYLRWDASSSKRKELGCGML